MALLYVCTLQALVQSSSFGEFIQPPKMLKKVLRLFIFLSLLVCFVLQVRESLSKYLSRQTANTRKEEVLDKLIPPHVTVCYDQSNLVFWNIRGNSTTDAVTREEMQASWDSMAPNVGQERNS